MKNTVESRSRLLEEYARSWNLFERKGEGKGEKKKERRKELETMRWKACRTGARNASSHRVYRERSQWYTFPLSPRPRLHEALGGTPRDKTHLRSVLSRAVLNRRCRRRSPKRSTPGGASRFPFIGGKSKVGFDRVATVERGTPVFSLRHYRPSQPTWHAGTRVRVEAK